MLSDLVYLFFLLVIVMLCSVIVVFPGHLLYFSFICGMCTVCHNLFSLPFGVIGRVSYVIVALPGTVSILVLLRIICLIWLYVRCLS